jgi:ankyrin repeat protein
MASLYSILIEIFCSFISLTKGGWFFQDFGNPRLYSLFLFHQVDREGQTALHIAVDASAKRTATYLLFKGAEVNAVRMNMATPLHLAATAGDVGIVEMLLNFKANVEAKNINHETPLHKAALFNHVPVIDLLLDK